MSEPCLHVLHAGTLGWMPWTYRTYLDLVLLPPYLRPLAYDRGVIEKWVGLKNPQFGFVVIYRNLLDKFLMVMTKSTYHKIQRFGCWPQRGQFFRSKHGQQFSPTFLGTGSYFPLVTKYCSCELVIIGKIDPPISVDEIMPCHVAQG